MNTRSSLAALRRCRSLSPLAVIIGLFLLYSGLGSTARAVGPAATGTLTQILDVSGTYTYNISIDNTGVISFSTFWLSWIPGDNFLNVEPLSESAPTNWTASSPTNGGGSDGWGIQYSTSTTPLASGNSLSGFDFTTTESPSQLLQNSTFHSGTSQLTSEVTTLSGGGGADSPAFVLAVVVPEPGTVAAFGLGCGLLVCWGGRRRG